MSTAIVANCVQFKTGTGKRGPWTLYKVTTTDGQEPTGFDFVQNGETIEITQTQNGQYVNLNYAKVDPAAVQQAAPAAAPAPAQAPYQAPAAQPVAAPAPAAPATSADPRALKLLVLIAQQMGVDQTRVANILDGKE